MKYHQSFPHARPLPLMLVLLSLAFIVCSCRSEKEALRPEFVEIPAGSFLMGADIGPEYIVAGPEKDWRSIFLQDEFPRRRVTITRGFGISKYEVTNAQYEAFDPDHRRWRGHFMDISAGDDEAVVYVSWEDAMAYTAWLSANDPDHDYRLPTEAEWEYVARAGTTTPFGDGVEGDIYGLNPFDSLLMERMHYQWPYPFTWSNGCRDWITWEPEPCIGVDDVYPNVRRIRNVDLEVGHHGPNDFGVYDMHGGVEEWVLDWYGHYLEADTIDPAGPRRGDFKVVRGGSHNNHVQHTRSANRMGSAVNDAHYFLGLRVVRVPKGQPRPEPVMDAGPRPWAEAVSDTGYQWPTDQNMPQFSMTSIFELVDMEADGSHYGSEAQLAQFGLDPLRLKPLPTGPLYTHNHSPSIEWCANGDILLTWFSGESEVGPELTFLASRGRRMPDGSLEWTPPGEFLKAADRNMHGSNLLNNALRLEAGLDKQAVLHQMTSIGLAGRWDKQGLGYRKSLDHGKTWTPVRMVLEPDHGLEEGALMQGNMLQTRDGKLVFVTDDEGDGQNTTGSLVVSDDGGESWYRRGHSSDTEGSSRIAGLHAAVVEIDDEASGQPALLAFGRDAGRYYEGKAPQSLSVDGGISWTRSASVFPSIEGMQRQAILRLHYSMEHPEHPGKTPLLLVSFANEDFPAKNTSGEMDEIQGLFVAVSFDEGKTWPEHYRKVVSPVKGAEETEITTAPWQMKNTLSRQMGQQIGYMSACQSPDGLIYLTDSKLVYTFNLTWVLQ